jgi:NTE family protein
MCLLNFTNISIKNQLMKNNSFNIKYIIVLFSSLLICSHLLSQEIVNNEVQRPKIGVVLSGGGAKGLAHIGVLKVLEELDLRPDYITGVSMGALVGGLYALGYSAEELDSIANDIDWKESFADKLLYNQVRINVKNDYKDYQIHLTGNDFNEVGLPIGVVDGRLISELLSGLSWGSIGTNDFDDYPIPFRCIATDIVSGKPIMFSSGNIAQAMRASMAIPTAFTPVVIDTLLLVDGGVVNNFPVKECFDMGADIVIGV